jgi:very-short-patch-repair endonuclease
MFLSMVDSPEQEGPLRMIGEGAFELTKKRYNVAASRARDQLWVVHSFDPDLHLKAADLRFKLLQHVRDPWAAIRAFDKEAQRTESPFEREVLKRLTTAGYGVKTQWQVGYFRIDLVVEGGGKRLAVECDGDRFHPIEKLAEDMERQAILERLGWQFVRIRGSAYYRNREQAMQPLFSKLEELGIFPEQERDVASVAKAPMVEELEALVVSMSSEPEGEPSGAMASVGDDEVDESEEGAVSSQFNDLTGDKVHRHEGDVEQLLLATGGVALVDDFLRRLSRLRGYKRLGRAVKKNLVFELAALKRRGKISVESGIVQLLRNPS